MITSIEYTVVNPKEKNSQWADRLIADFRRSWDYLCNPTTAKLNMEYLLSSQSVAFVKDMFKNPDETKLKFARIAVVEKYRNILIAERDKAGISLGLNCIDPSVTDKSKKIDKELLANRKNIEALLSTLYQKIGEAPYKIKNEGFSGNIESFDEIGLNDEDDEDLNYFFENYWRLNMEIKGEIPIQYFVQYNELQSYLPKWCNDILAKKSVSMRTYVNQNTGAITYEYLAPETVKGIFGTRQDLKDSLCLGFEKNVTIHQLIRMIGNEFNPATDFRELLNSVNYQFAQQYTGLEGRTGNILCHDSTIPQPKICSWSEFINYKLTIGYVEWKSIDADASKVGNSVHGNEKRFWIDYDAKVKEDGYYQKEVLYNEKTYCSYFVPTSSSSQKLFRFGPLYHQTVEGGEEEYSNFSIAGYREVGPPAIEVMRPYIDMIQQAWTKFEWMVRAAKPQGRTYNYESLVQIANKMVTTGNNADKVNALMKTFQEGINDIYTIPTINGEKVGGGQNPYFNKPNGLDASAKDFLDTIIWCNEKLGSDFGINSIREAYSPSPNDGYKLQMATLAQSRNATEYMSMMLLSMMRHAGIQTTLMIQHIISYKAHLPYKFLVDAIGQDTVNAIEQSKFALHRFGIFISSFNTDMERQEMKQAAQQAYFNKEIDYATYMFLNSIDSYKKAGQRLAFEKKKAEKEKIRQVQQQQQNAMQAEAQQHNNKMEEIDLTGKLRNRGEEIKGYYYQAGHEADGQVQLTKKDKDIEAAKEKITEKATSDVNVATAKQNLESSKV